jgi:mRNA-degrading endonuclease toxin of MazEF toxin-antitoxin module
MPTAGDVVDLDLARARGAAGRFPTPRDARDGPAILDAHPSGVHVVPVTTRGFHSEVLIEPDDTNDLDGVSAAQCQHIRAVSPDRIAGTRGNVGAALLSEFRETIAIILGLP